MKALVSPHYVLGIMLSALEVLTYLILTQIQRSKCCYCRHLTDPEIESLTD